MLQIRDHAFTYTYHASHLKPRAEVAGFPPVFGAGGGGNDRLEVRGAAACTPDAGQIQIDERQGLDHAPWVCLDTSEERRGGRGRGRGWSWDRGWGRRSNRATATTTTHMRRTRSHPTTTSTTTTTTDGEAGASGGGRREVGRHFSFSR
jgi:hypothetical protein